MKKTLLTLLTFTLAGMLYAAAQEDNPPPMPDGGPGGPGGPPPEMAPEAPNAGGSSGTTSPHTTVFVSGRTNTVPGAITNTAQADIALPTQFMPPTEGSGTNGEEGLRLNFHDAPIEMVLNYLSDAAGFIIVLATHVNGNISVISSHPMSKDEAVDLLNSVLNQDGYAAIRDGRTLTIVDKNDAKTRDIPVKSGNNPLEIPKNDEIVTQIIPIRFVEASQLVSDLSSFVSPQATVVANEAGNSIVITDTQANIRHLAEIIQAVDNSAEAETEIRVFRMKYASPVDVANELSSIFPSANGSNGNTQSPIRFGGFGGGFMARMMGGGGGGGGSSSGNSSSDRIKKATQVTAVADSRIQAVIVTAPKDLMDQIGSMMDELDVPSTRDQNVYVYHLNNADAQQAYTVLQGIFPAGGSSSSSRSSSTSSTQTDPLAARVQSNASSSSSSSSGTGSSSFGGSSGRGGGGGTQF